MRTLKLWGGIFAKDEFSSLQGCFCELLWCPFPRLKLHKASRVPSLPTPQVGVNWLGALGRGGKRELNGWPRPGPIYLRM